VAKASWWEWVDGSRPFFWRWPIECRDVIQDGLNLWTKGMLPHFKCSQPPDKDGCMRAMMTVKLSTVQDCRYVAPGRVDSLTWFFMVPKGDNDIWMVYNGSKSGLNDILWVP